MRCSMSSCAAGPPSRRARPANDRVPGSMCGRFTLTVPDLDLLAELLGVEADPALAEQYRPRYNVAPSDAHLIVAGRQLLGARWGLGGQPQINARSETAAELPTLRPAFAPGPARVRAHRVFEW